MEDTAAARKATRLLALWSKARPFVLGIAVVLGAAILSGVKPGYP